MRIGTGLHGVDLTAQHSFLNAMMQLDQSSLRLSTMRRINRGADDPAGLIAVGMLQSNLSAIGAVSSSAARAVGVVHVADSALSSVSGLIRSIRTNVVAAAGGMLSNDQIAAKQLEVDSALAAINRIGQTTSFGGRQLLNGDPLTFNFSLDGTNPSTLALPEVSSASLGGTAGVLNDLASGGSASLTSGNLAKAFEVLDTASLQILSGRAEAGAFERYSIESSQAVMDSMEENLSSALSQIYDTDVALETSRMIQARILAKMSVMVMSATNDRHRFWSQIGLGGGSRE
jgi:flagellin